MFLCIAKMRSVRSDAVDGKSQSTIIGVVERLSYYRFCLLRNHIETKDESNVNVPQGRTAYESYGGILCHKSVFSLYVPKCKIWKNESVEQIETNDYISAEILNESTIQTDGSKRSEA